jgi:hypothetical protein
MKDIIVGRVAEVIDPGTLDVEVTQVVRKNHDVYGRREKVRYNILQDRLRTWKDIRKKEFLEAILKGRGVMCLVIGRASDGRIEADVYALGL